MSRARSTAERYKPDHGPIVFGVPGLDVRWNRKSKCVIVEVTGDRETRWVQNGEIGELVLLALAAAHNRGRLLETLRTLLGVEHETQKTYSEFYRVGKLLCWKPSWHHVPQQPARTVSKPRRALAA